MDSRHLVDRELAAALDLLPSMELSFETLSAWRTQLAEMYRRTAALLPSSTDVERRVVFLPGPENSPEVRLLIYTPPRAEAKRPAYFYIHGGGFVMGAPDQNEIQSRAIAL